MTAALFVAFAEKPLVFAFTTIDGSAFLANVFT
jgi:hypothetical protein